MFVPGESSDARVHSPMLGSLCLFFRGLIVRFTKIRILLVARSDTARACLTWQQHTGVCGVSLGGELKTRGSEAGGCIRTSGVSLGAAMRKI